ncbi:potassium channel family protein [Ancylomarina longa]|uniref:Potassium channel protein n=1 Tax=Ancylomarina longa TaxID=2487017 RepID=A0A434AF05_9BACT|nr:potassium channel protein [Ancylomarina longa]RUT72967.1 potassium channel protein [Ancylomarina longa]
MNRQKIWEENVRTISMAVFFMLLAILLGTFGFMYLDDAYSFIDGLYMTVITISTVGFKEVHSLSDSGKLFTVFLILISFGIFGYLASSVTRFILDGVFRRNLKDYRIVRKIEKIKDHVIVCGFGRNGRQASLELIAHGEIVVVVDSKETAIDRVREFPELLFIQGDATREEVLDMANISSAKALITAIPRDAENVYVVLTAREMNAEIKIISRSSHSQSDNKLKRAGADNVIMPDRLGGQQMAKLVAQPDIVEFLDNILLQSTKGVKLEEISCQSLADYFIGKSIQELNVRDQFGANIIGLKDTEGGYIYNPSANIVLDRGYYLFVMINKEEVSNFKRYLSSGN